jgi:hypothetical protein
MSLGHILYISDALTSERAALENIRSVSTHYNARNGITGVLFYSAGQFVQLLEGDPDDIRHLFAKIERDPRHKNVRLLIERPTPKRLFPDWNMGLLNLDQYSDKERKDLNELIALAQSNDAAFGDTPIEMEILSRFCMLLPAD